MPKFVVVMGGSGSGKNFYIENHPTLSTYQLIDVDPKAGMGDDRTGLGSRVAQMKRELAKALSDKVNIVHPTTGVNFSSLKNKLASARRLGYETTVVLIDTDPSIAHKNIQKRVAAGGHGGGIPAWKVDKTNAEARANFEDIKNDNTLVDNAFKVSGRAMIESMLRQYVRLLIQ